MEEVAYEAPATVANFGPGFDIFGGAMTYPRGDLVSAERINSRNAVRLVEIINESGLENLNLTLGPENVVQAVGQKIYDDLHGTGGIELRLYKRMKIGTGTGSSASSSVAAALSVSYLLLENPLLRSDRRILEAVVHGESVATKGLGHADNVWPCLLGSFIFIYDLRSFFSCLNF